MQIIFFSSLKPPSVLKAEVTGLLVRVASMWLEGSVPVTSTHFCPTLTGTLKVLPVII